MAVDRCRVRWKYHGIEVPRTYNSSVRINEPLVNHIFKYFKWDTVGNESNISIVDFNVFRKIIPILTFCYGSYYVT